MESDIFDFAKRRFKMQTTNWQTVDEAIEWLHSLLMHGIKPGLTRMEWICERLGHPERRLKFVHIGGTNGKGSTVTFMRHVLQDAGYEVGTFTSPYIERFNNRIQVNGQDIPDDLLLECCKRLKPLVDELAEHSLGSPTEFEVITAIALLYFAEYAYPDLVLWEVGLGGRLDSTNVVMPILSIITNIGYDHIHILGNTLEQIASEKAGIIKSGVPLVTAVKHEGAFEVIARKAREKKASLYHLDAQFKYQMLEQGFRHTVFNYTSLFSRYDQLALSQAGVYQLENAAVSIMGLEILKQYYAIIWEEENLRTGLQRMAWMGRMETLVEEPLVLIEGAHNQQGMEALAESLKSYFINKRVSLVFSMIEGKSLQQLLEPVLPLVEQISICEFEFPKAAKLSDLQQQAEAMSASDRAKLLFVKSWEEIYSNWKSVSTADDVLIFTGSLYFISQVRAALK